MPWQRYLHRFSEPLRKFIKHGTSKVVRVRELLSWFQAQRRGILVVSEIRSALKKAKLATVPEFEVAYIDQRIKLKAAEPADKNLVTKVIVIEEHGAGVDAAVVGGSIPDSPMGVDSKNEFPERWERAFPKISERSRDSRGECWERVFNIDELAST